MSPQSDVPSLPAVGARARLRRQVERFPHFVAEAGAAGTITTASEELIAMKLDRVLPGAEGWDNEVCWNPEVGEAIAGPDATAEEQVAAAFHADAEIVGPLRFCDHHRQRYAEKVPIPEAGEFLIGDYTDEGTIGGDGEFRVTLVELRGDRRWSLYPHLEVYGEGVPALHRAIDAGLLDALGPVNSRDEFARRLLAIGLVDRSDTLLPEARS
jgi:hypothetical protein